MFPPQDHPKNNPERTRRIFPSFASARAVLQKRQAELGREREHVRQLVLSQASAALRAVLGMASGSGGSGGGMQSGDPQSELDLSAARTTEDGLPFVDPVERLPE